MEYVKNLLNKSITKILILAVFSTIPIYQTGLGGIINKTDFHFPIYPHFEFVESLFIWNSNVTGFMDISTITKLWPRNIVVAVFSNLFNVEIAQRLYLFLIFFGVSYSGYYLIKILFKYSIKDADNKIVEMCSIIGGILLLYNPFIFFHINGGQFEYAYSLIGMNLIYAYLVQYMNSRSYKYIVYASLATSLIFSSTYTIIVLGAFFVLLVASLVILTLKRNAIKGIFIFGLLLFLVNMYIILPLFVLIQHPTAGELQTISSNTLKEISSKDFIDISRLWVTDVENRFPFHPYWRHYFSSVSLRILGIALFSISLIALIKERENKIVLFSGLVLILFLNLSFGLYSAIFKVLWQNSQFFIVFRDPSKFYQIILISFSVLFAYSLYHILSLLKKRKKVAGPIFFVVLILVAIIINVKPMTSGNLEGSLSPVQYPADYFEAKKIIEKNKTSFRVLVLPQFNGPVKLGYYYWNKQYDFVGPLDLVIFKSVIDMKPLPRGSLKSAELVKAKFVRNNPTSFENILDTMNIRYIIINNDFIDRTTKEKITYKYQKILLNSDELTLVSSSKNLNVLEYKYSKPRIYPTANIVGVKSKSLIPNILLGFPHSLFPTILIDNISSHGIMMPKNYTVASVETVNVAIYNGSNYKFSWRDLPTRVVEARYYIGRKSVIRTDGAEQEDTLSCPSLDSCPYKFPSFSPTGWNAFNSTLIYIKTGNMSLRIDYIRENNKSIEDIAGVWWETGWMGMSTKPVEFPVVIPPDQRAIIQINHKTENLSINTIGLENLSKLKNMKENDRPLITFKRINPTKYIVNVENATKPFFLVFSESYNPGWKIYSMNRNTNLGEVIAKYPDVNVKEAMNSGYEFTPLDVVYLLKKPIINETYHFKANGYANTWYINPEAMDKDGNGNFTATIYFSPQSYFYLGLFISITTLILSIGYIFYGWRRNQGDRWVEKTDKKIKTVWQKLW